MHPMDGQLTIAVVPYPPQIQDCFSKAVKWNEIVYHRSPNICQRPGIHVESTLYVLKYLNITSFRFMYVGGIGQVSRNGTKATGLIGMLHNGSADLSVIMLAATELRRRYVDFIPFHSDSFTGCFLMHPTLHVPPVNPFTVFTPWFWMATILLQLLTSATLFKVNQEAGSYSSTIYSLSFEQKNKKKFETLSSKVIVTIWCLSAWIIQLVFKSIYISRFSIRYKCPHSFNHLAAFIGPYKLQMLKYSFIADAVLNSNQDGMSEIRQKLHQTPPIIQRNLDKFTHYVINTPGTIALVYKTYGEHILSNNSHLVMKCTEEFVVPTSFVMSKNLPEKLKNRIGQAVRVLNVFGIDKHIKRGYIMDKTLFQQADTRLESLWIEPVVIVIGQMGLGLFIGVIVLIFEITLYNCLISTFVLF